MNKSKLHVPLSNIVLILAMILSSFASLKPTGDVWADHTADPASVTVAGSLQSELGCPGDWQPDCAATHLAYDANDDVWQVIFDVPAGNWEYKAPLNDGWDENYGANAQQNGPNIGLNLTDPASVKFYYDHKSHWITDNQNSVIAVAPGSFQSELGCSGDWDPGCLRSWLQDTDGDGIYTFEASGLPAGSYEGKVALNESWDENYGAGGEPNGANIPFNVPSLTSIVKFNYNSATHVLDIQVLPGTTVTLVGSLQSELGCTNDWDPTCTATDLAYDLNDDVYQRAFEAPPASPSLPAGSYEYKAALDHSWTVNYGRYAAQGGENIPLDADGGAIKFYFDPKSHWITDSQRSVIVVAPGNFQSELGCPGDWQPDCLRSWLQNPDEDGIYTFETTQLPAGNYEAKAALNESWDVNYGQDGAQNGANIPFFVPFDNATVRFEYNAATHVLTILSGFGPDNNIAWDGLRHDSRDLLYRTPGGAVPEGTPVTIRFRTFHNDVTGVDLRVFSLEDNAQFALAMTQVATDVSCYETDLGDSTCDFWAVTLPNEQADNLWYRFIVTDGSDTDYYDDNTAALDGGLGAATDDPEDNSFALMVYEPDFEAPGWAQDAFIYQIFPDRFRDGRSNNNPQTGDVRYDDPVLALPWGTLPEGYCRNYADANATTCPWRFDDTPPDWSPDKEGPRGRDYFGGDLQGVTQKLDYLQSLGVTAIYFNPIFTSQSNHGYDTANFRQIDPGLGTHKEFKTLVAEAEKRGIHVILDGVFNHMSSDSPFFDRYHHYDDVGACESPASPWRSWFIFRDVPAGTGTCVDSQGNLNSALYEGWFGFDSIPVLNKSNPEVQRYFLTSPNSISRSWLKEGAGGWRMDVSGDPSFPDGYWETFRQVTKSTVSDALLISETWQKDSTLLRMLRGDRLDTTMNYRLRDAVIGLLTPGNFDSKGFADSGRSLAPSEFAARLASIREDYPDAAYYSLMNLLDSHDTERLLWTLTPAESETRANKEFNAANLADGKLNLQIASLIQFTMPGAPTIFYGDEVGLTGDDDPDDRRTYPWADLGGTPDQNLFNHYQTLADLRADNTALTDGDFRILLADDATEVIAYGRKTSSQAAVVLINRSEQPQTGAIPVEAYLPDGTILYNVYDLKEDGPGSVSVVNGFIGGTIGPKSAWLLLTQQTDLQPPTAPESLHVTGEGDGEVSLAWDDVSGAAGYNVYQSPVTGGGFIKVGSVNGTNFTDSGLRNAQTYFYVVTALDAAGNESAYSNEAEAVPHYTIGWANLQWPPEMTHIISVTDRTDDVYGQVWINNVTNQSGPTPGLVAQLGFGPNGSDPAGNLDWTWVDASFNVDAGNNDEFFASLLPEATGTFDYAYRYSTTNGRDWVYADLDGIGNGYSPAQAGNLTVNPSGDTTPPEVPTGLSVVSASPDGIYLTWDALLGDASLYGYEVLRSDTAGGPYTRIARVISTSYVDTDVVQSATYYYVLRSVDLSFNRSAYSEEVSATAELRTVTLVLNVTVPDWTPTDRSVHIAGTLSRLDGDYVDWNSSAVSLSPAGTNRWTITFTGLEGTQIEYKYTLGSPDFFDVEKGASCDEIANRMVTLSFGSTGTLTVEDTVLNWRNVSPCGN